MHVKSIIVLILFSITVGCGTAIKPELTENADYGEYPSNYEEIAESWFDEELKDPFSAEFRFQGEPTKAYHRSAAVTGGKVAGYGYIVYVDVNAKNSFGAYTGWKEYRLFIRNGEVIGRIEPNMYFEEPWYDEYEDEQ